MVAGRFRSFQHGHRCTATPGGTRLDDELRFTMPFGPLGWVVGQVILVPHIRGLMRRRFRLLKRIAEGNEWRRYLVGWSGVPEDVPAPQEAGSSFHSE